MVPASVVPDRDCAGMVPASVVPDRDCPVSRHREVKELIAYRIPIPTGIQG